MHYVECFFFVKAELRKFGEVRSHPRTPLGYATGSKSITLEMPSRTGYFRRAFEGRPVSLHM